MAETVGCFGAPAGAPGRLPWQVRAGRMPGGRGRVGPGHGRVGPVETAAGRRPFGAGWGGLGQRVGCTPDEPDLSDISSLISRNGEIRERIDRHL
jgi:hypothetical protein